MENAFQSDNFIYIFFARHAHSIASVTPAYPRHLPFHSVQFFTNSLNRVKERKNRYESNKEIAHFYQIFHIAGAININECNRFGEKGI